MQELAEWDTFYVILGGAAGALIGLQFVVITLIANRPTRGAADAQGAFSSPTIVHFSAALLLSLLVRVPWHAMAPMAAAWGITGALGVAYVAFVARRMRRQGAYRPELEDWTFFVALPALAYAALIAAALLAVVHPRAGMFASGGGALVLLFAGIHNTWDSVTYLVFVHLRNRPPGG
ncbi:hypothetical protein [Anaeromyxobacter diazotrophicus]|uniref:Uncharacterized protein n=1 Tax=Anaeromyxobacter diazotrophicus TaxID=2590199 RepID=A0A7I9VRB5_9BACT|nr:hypothetical protein [Anaeromyxobacter diazotrophicus]GEJ58778.1 hypothetical protein AMYX_35190 [Anaeromyxobacter diazotrophicus]